jgi:hypothetical protein
MDNLTPQEMAQIEGYWKKNDSPAERQQTNDRLSNDRDFKAAAYDMMAMLDQLDELSKQKALRKRLNSIGEQMPPFTEATPRPFLSFRRVAVAAGVALLIGVLWTFISPPSLTPTQKMALDALKMPGWSGTDMGQSDELKNKAAIAYVNGDYEETAAALEDYFNAGGSDPVMKFYLALSYVATKQPQKALPLLQALQTQPGMDATEINWYTAIALTLNQQLDQARPLLQSVSNSKNVPFNNYATNLLQQINTSE